MMREICAVLTFVVVFWNVENFFDPFDSPDTVDEEFTPSGEKHWTWSKFVRKRDDIAKTLLSIKAETGDYPAVAGLAEIENSFVLHQLTDKSPLSDLNYGFVHRESRDKRGIDVGLLYKKDLFHICEVDSIRFETVRTRDVLYVKGTDNHNDTLHLFVIHLPSKIGGNEAESLRFTILSALESRKDSILSINPASRIIVMGDFNAGPVSNHCGTYKYHGKWSTIDRFCVTNIFADTSIYRVPFLLEKDKTWMGEKPRRTYIGPRYNGGISDHLPVILKIR